MNLDLQTIENLFTTYTYGTQRPVKVPNTKNVMDCSGFVGWYLGQIYNLPSMAEDPYTWTLYRQLDYIGKLYYKGPTEELDLNKLENGDIVIFSNSTDFWTPQPYNYWCGVNWDRYTFLNFNTQEGFGSQPITLYLHWFPSFTNVAVFRMQGIVDRDSMTPPPPAQPM